MDYLKDEHCLGIIHNISFPFLSGCSFEAGGDRIRMRAFKRWWRHDTLAVAVK